MKILTYLYVMSIVIFIIIWLTIDAPTFEQCFILGFSVCVCSVGLWINEKLKE
jgi:hypothetical protein